MTTKEIENMFTYHSPVGDQTDRYQELRQKARELAFTIEALCPSSREKSVAFTRLQQAIMWANASITINEELFPSGVAGRGV
jgi:hypothetical protein